MNSKKKEAKDEFAISKVLRFIKLALNYKVANSLHKGNNIICTCHKRFWLRLSIDLLSMFPTVFYIIDYHFYSKLFIN